MELQHLYVITPAAGMVHKPSKNKVLYLATTHKESGKDYKAAPCVRFRNSLSSNVAARLQRDISNETCAYVRCNAVGLAGMPNPSAFRLRDVLAIRANNVDILAVSDTVELPSLPVPVGLIPAARGTRE